MKLATTYEPNAYEPNIYAMWETSGQFAPQGEGEPYSIVMPPPNANAGGSQTGGGGPLPQTDSQVYYRITTRVAGPRSTTVYTQTIVAI